MDAGEIECPSEENTRLSGINKDIQSESLQSYYCTGCKKQIQDQYVLKVNDQYWHENCLQCFVCRRTLLDSCFNKDSKFFCRTDYRRLYGAKCATCKQPIAANELVMTALTNLYHLHCFKCDECGKTLEKGDEFMLKDDRLFCKNDFQANQADGESDADSSLDSPDSEHTAGSFPISPTASDKSSQDDKGRSIKRPRTILTSHQRKEFKAAFEISPKPCRKVREELSRDTGLSVRVVQVWFQNQRAKLKKMAKKSHPSNGGDEEQKRSGKGKRKSRQKAESHQPKAKVTNTEPDTPPLTPLPPSRTQSSQMSSFDSMSSIQDPYNQGPPPNMQPFYPTPPPPSLTPGNNFPSISQHGPPPPPPPYGIPSRDFPDDVPPMMMDGGHMNLPMHYGPNMNHNYHDAISEAAAQNHLQLMHHMLNSF